jgi:hypothetical protein
MLGNYLYKSQLTKEVILIIFKKTFFKKYLFILSVVIAAQLKPGEKWIDPDFNPKNIKTLVGE